MDNIIQNQITPHLLSGQELAITYHTFTSSKHDLTTSSGLIQVHRSLARLAAVFITSDRDIRRSPPIGYREFNNFKHPDYIEAQLQIGSKQFPDMKNEFYTRDLR